MDNASLEVSEASQLPRNRMELQVYLNLILPVIDYEPHLNLGSTSPVHRD